jgi:type IV pilus assembly protein PilO
MSLQETLQKLNEIDFNDLNSIDFNNVGMWPLAGKAAVWVVLFAVVVFGLYQVNISPLLEEFHKEEAKEQTLRADFEKKVNDSANLEAYRIQMAEMEASFEALLKQLPQETEVPGLLDDISVKGEDSGLVFDVVDLQAEKKEEFYIELPIEIIARGGYHDFGSFVSGIASLPRIVTLGDFSIAPVANKGKNAPKSPASEAGGKGDLSMKIIAKTYRYRPKEDNAPVATAKTKKKAGGAK